MDPLSPLHRLDSRPCLNTVCRECVQPEFHLDCTSVASACHSITAWPLHAHSALSECTTYDSACLSHPSFLDTLSVNQRHPWNECLRSFIPLNLQQVLNQWGSCLGGLGWDVPSEPPKPGFAPFLLGLLWVACSSPV